MLWTRRVKQGTGWERRTAGSGDMKGRSENLNGAG